MCGWLSNAWRVFNIGMQWNVSLVRLSFCLGALIPLPNKKYGNDMANLGPYMAHMWKWYGMVGWPYGVHMGPNFCKFQALESIWKEKPMLPIVWESYGDRMLTEIPYNWLVCLPHALYGINMGYPHFMIPHVIYIPADSNFFSCIEFLYD